MQAQGVHYGGDAVQAADTVLGVHAAQAGNGADGLCDRFGFADAAGFDNDIVETFHPHDFAYLLFLAHDAALLDEVRVNVYLAYVIDDNCESDALFVGENMVY